MDKKKSVSKKKPNTGNTSTHHIVQLRLQIHVYDKLLWLAERGGVHVGSYVKMVLGDHIVDEERKDR